TCSIVAGCCRPLIHSHAACCCAGEPPAPMSSVSPPNGVTTAWPDWRAGIGAMPYCWLYFHPTAFSSGKIHGPLIIMAAFECRNCWVRSGSWPHVRTDLDADPSLTMFTHSWSACWNCGELTLVSDAPLDQKNGSSCQVDCSSLVASNAMP